MIHHGDCLDVMATLDAASVDAIVTDPPYGLGFMGKAWDQHVGMAAWAAALRVAKPSAYLLAFGGTRTYHRMAVAIEDAGWVIRDCLVWAYASGFPKSRALLKPAWEPIVMARKPGPLRMLNIDGCRIPLQSGEGEDWREGQPAADRRYSKGGNDGFAATPSRRITKGGPSVNAYGDGLNTPTFSDVSPTGRWPANVILTDPIFDGGAEGVIGGGVTAGAHGGHGEYEQHAWMRTGTAQDIDPDDGGTYSRFFILPKAGRVDREPILGGLTTGFAATMGNGIGGREHDPADPRAYRQNVHPTVKPVDLMRHLVRLVTPPGGLVLDPFLGSGTTAIAAEMEGFRWIGIEREAEYVAIAEARLNGTQRGLGLPA